MHRIAIAAASALTLQLPIWAAWIEMPNLPNGHDPVIVRSGGRIYSMGGRSRTDGSYDGQAYVHDEERNKWTGIARVPEPYQDTTPTDPVTLKDGRIMLFLHERDYGYIGIYDPASNAWALRQTGLPPFYATIHRSMLLKSGRVLTYFYDDPYGVGADTLIYDPDADSWTPTASPNDEYYVTAMVRLPNGDPALLGAVESPQCETYDETTGTWRLLADMPTSNQLWSTILPPRRIGNRISYYQRFYDRQITYTTYDAATDAWSESITVQTPLNWHTCIIEGRIAMTYDDKQMYWLDEQWNQTTAGPKPYRSHADSGPDGEDPLLWERIYPQTGRGYFKLYRYLPGNRPPVLNAQDLVLDEDGRATGAFQARDVDYGDEVTTGVLVRPAHGTLTLAQGTYSYVPDVNFNGQDAFQLYATDGKDLGTATVQVTVNAVDDPPGVQIISPLLVEPGEQVTLVADGRDPDGDPVSYSWLVEDMVLQGPVVGHVFASEGSYPVRVVASAGGTTSSAAVTVEVHRRPSALFTATEPVAFRDVPIGFEATDPEGDADYSWRVDDDLLHDHAPKVVTKFQSEGMHAVTLSVHRHGWSAEERLNVLVLSRERMHGLRRRDPFLKMLWRPRAGHDGLWFVAIVGMDGIKTLEGARVSLETDGAVLNGVLDSRLRSRNGRSTWKVRKGGRGRNDEDLSVVCRASGLSLGVPDADVSRLPVILKVGERVFRFSVTLTVRRSGRRRPILGSTRTRSPVQP